MLKKTKKYFKVFSHFRNEEYQFIIICDDENDITGEIVAGYICRKFQTTVPSAEISFTKAKTTMASSLLVHELDTYEISNGVVSV